MDSRFEPSGISEDYGAIVRFGVVSRWAAFFPSRQPDAQSTFLLRSDLP